MVCVRLAIFPNCVSMPVAKTTALPLPLATLVLMNTRLGEYRYALSTAFTSLAFLGCGSDSPVNGTLFVHRSKAAIKRASAGTRSPASKTMTSPGTISLTRTFWSSPSRTTLAYSGIQCLRVCMAFSARDSWKRLKNMFSSTTPRIIRLSSHSPLMAESALAKSSSTPNRSLKCDSSLYVKRRFFFSTSVLKPCFLRRALASSVVKPLGDASKASKTCLRRMEAAFSKISLPKFCFSLLFYVLYSVFWLRKLRSNLNQSETECSFDSIHHVFPKPLP